MLNRTEDIAYELELLRLQKIRFDHTGHYDDMELLGDYFFDVIFETLDAIFDQG